MNGGLWLNGNPTGYGERTVPGDDELLGVDTIGDRVDDIDCICGDEDDIVCAKTC